MIQYSGSEIYWNYFLALEQSLVTISRYIEFHATNEKVYSIELTRLLFSASAEFDVITKDFCQSFHSQYARDNIVDYYKVLSVEAPDFLATRIVIDRFGIETSPFDTWTASRSPEWWQSYNNVKHHRTTAYNEANLKNVINSLGALLAASILFYNRKFLGPKKTQPGHYQEVYSRLKALPTLLRIDGDAGYISYDL